MQGIMVLPSMINYRTMTDRVPAEIFLSAKRNITCREVRTNTHWHNQQSGKHTHRKTPLVASKRASRSFVTRFLRAWIQRVCPTPSTPRTRDKLCTAHVTLPVHHMCERNRISAALVDVRPGDSNGVPALPAYRVDNIWSYERKSEWYLAPKSYSRKF